MMKKEKKGVYRPDFLGRPLVFGVFDVAVAGAIGFGALPTSCHPLYQIDGEALLEYVEQVSDPNSFAAYLPRFLKF